MTEIISQVDGRLLAASGITTVVVSFFVMRRYPKLAFCAWVLTLCLVPVWVGVNVPVYLPALTLVSGIVVVALFGLREIRINYVDWLVLFLIAIYCVSLMVGAARVTDGLTLLTSWVLGYGLGRVCAVELGHEWIHRAIAVAFSIVAVLAIVEFFSGQNVFVNLLAFSNPHFDLWGELQPRAGQLRAEGAFGHSIALGASLAIAAPMVIAAPIRMWVRTMMLVVLLAAAALTFSRIGLVSCVLAVVLALAFMPSDLSRRARLRLVAVLAAVSAAAFPLLSTTFSEAEGEASGSAAYRRELLALVPRMRPFGVSDAFQVSPEGKAYFGDFRSIDSALILIGLTYGVIPLLIVGALLLAAVAIMLRGTASPATIAIVAQIPALATVALITQYALFLWFVGGVAATAEAIKLARQRKNEQIRYYEFPEVGHGRNGTGRLRSVTGESQVGGIEK